MDLIRIGSFLAELRHEKGLTQQALGERLGVTNKTISRWETGCYPENSASASTSWLPANGLSPRISKKPPMKTLSLHWTTAPLP